MADRFERHTPDLTRLAEMAITAGLPAGAST
jgi:hypothetical protein